MKNKLRVKILNHQIERLAYIYLCKPISSNNWKWHNRVLQIQADCIREKLTIKNG